MNNNQQNPGGGGGQNQGGGAQNVPPVAVPNQPNVAVPVNGGITATGLVWTGGSGDLVACALLNGPHSPMCC